jgi:hypothetical protein
MTIIRRRHNARFTIIPNSIFEDERLSVEAKGTLGYLLSRPHNWTVRLVQVAHTLGTGRDKMERIFQELRTIGYVVRGEQHRFRGQWGAAEFIVFDDPNLPENKAAPCPEKPLTAEPDAVFQGTYKGLKDNNTDAADARALDRKPLVTPEAISLTEQIATIAGVGPSKDWPPGWCGAPMRVQSMLANGWRPEIMLGSARATMAKRSGRPPPSTVNFFEKPFAEAHAMHAKPLPVVEISQHQERIIINGQARESRGNGNGGFCAGEGFSARALRIARELAARDRGSGG